MTIFFSSLCTMSVLTVDDYRNFFAIQQNKLITQQKGSGFNRYRLEPFQFQQNGEGIGSFFVNLLRNQILPLVPSLLKNSAGLALGVANSLSNNANNERFGSILKRHGREALKNMAVDTLGHVGKQFGSGKRKFNRSKKKKNNKTGKKPKLEFY